MIYYKFKGLYKQTESSNDMRIGQIGIDSRWSWLAMVDRLSDGDITKHDNIYNRNYIECLNLLSYWHERDAYLKQINEIKNSR